MILLRSKRIKIIAFSTILILALAALFLYLSYAKQTNAVLIKYSRMNQIAPNVYVEPEINESEQAELIDYVQISTAKINALFGQKESAPVVIYAKSKRLWIIMPIQILDKLIIIHGITTLLSAQGVITRM